MKWKYNRLFDKITPVGGDEEFVKSVLRKAEKMEIKKKLSFKKAVIMPIAAIIGLFATAITAGAIYEGIQFLQKSEYTQINEFTEKISTFVYEDSNDNMKMTVEEAITDGKLSIVTIHYQALNDEGIKGFDRIYVPFSSNSNDKLRIDVGYACGSTTTTELEEYRTEKDRYYLLTCCRDRIPTDTSDDEIIIKYSFGNLIEKTAIISPDEIFEKKWYRLKSDKHGTDLFTPEYIELSDLTYTVYGMQHKVMNESRSQIILPEDFDCRRDIGFSLVMNDGTEINLDDCSGYLGNLTPDVTNMHNNLIVCDGQFLEDERYYRYIPVEKIIGVKICGIIYELVPIE